MGLVNVLSRLANVLWEAKLNAASLLIARKGELSNSSYAGFPTRDLGFNLALAANAEHLAQVLHHLRDLSPSLEQANLARRLYEQATAADPSNSHWPIGLTMMWARIAKLRWDLGQADESLAAFRESTRIQRELFEADSSSSYHRYNLDRCYGRLANWSTKNRDWAGTAAALLERVKLWPDDSDRLTGVAHDFNELAEEMARGPKSLSADEQIARQHYLAESERIRQAAETNARRRSTA